MALHRCQLGQTPAEPADRASLVLILLGPQAAHGRAPRHCSLGLSSTPLPGSPPLLPLRHPTVSCAHSYEMTLTRGCESVTLVPNPSMAPRVLFITTK